MGCMATSLSNRVMENHSIKSPPTPVGFRCLGYGDRETGWPDRLLGWLDKCLGGWTKVSIKDSSGAQESIKEYELSRTPA